MPAPRVSVVMPVYNGERYLEMAIGSVLEQDADFELVVSDDASTDATLAIVRGIADPRLRLIENSRNLGIFGNLNRAVAQSAGALVQVFSQDDLMSPGFLASQAAMLDQHGQAGLVYDTPVYIDAGGDKIIDYVDTTPEVIDFATYLWISSHYGALPPSISSIMVRREAFAALGGFDESFRVAGDLDFYNRLSERFGLVRNPAGLHKVRGHSQAASAHSSAGPSYLAEEARLADWYRGKLSAEDYEQVSRYRCATRGRYHLAWIYRAARRGRLAEAARALALLNSVYPLRWTMGALAATRFRGAPVPSLAPPQT